MKNKPDSNCVICKKPAKAPKGNFNVNRVTLCKSKKCRHQRKMEMQKARRMQKELPLMPKRSKHDSSTKGNTQARASRVAWKSGLMTEKVF